MKFAEIPGKLHTLLMPPDPIVINHIITVEGPDARKTACYDIDVEVVSNLITSYLLETSIFIELLDKTLILFDISTLTEAFNIISAH